MTAPARPLRFAAATAIAVGGALLALGSGLDRAGIATPLALWPSTAPQVTGLLALAQRKPEAALNASEQAVRSDPISAQAASTLGTARLASGDAAGAEAAFRVAGQLGWRDRQAQLYWVVAGTAVGAHEIAAQRADALLRQDATLIAQPLLLGGLLGSPDGRRALAERLATRPSWFEAFFGSVYMLSPADVAARALMLDEPSLRPPAVTCDDVRVIVAMLAQTGAGARGRAIWRRYCGGASSLLIDGGFERARSDNTAPFGWQFAGIGGLDQRLTPEAGFTGRAVRVENGLPSRQVFATQPLQLGPGRYVLSWRARDGGRAPSARIAARIACQGGGDATGPATAAGDRFTAPVEIAGDCALQTLSLSVAVGSGAVFVDDIGVVPAR